MFGSIKELEELYAKVKEGRATLDEYANYTLILKTQCIKEDTLLTKLERNYKEKSQK